MSVNVLIDMNLSAQWVEVLAKHGWSAVHWSTVGNRHAEDSVIMEWALDHEHMVFTHDLDFGTALALTESTGPSILQVRGDNVLPESMAASVIEALKKYEVELGAGALVVVDEKKSRARVLPIKRTNS